MKKTLYSTTFLATAGVLALGASDAFAQAAAPAAEKLKLSLGGYMTQYVSWSDYASSWENANSNYYKHFDQKSDTEIYFNGSLKLDNGLTVAVVQQLEADTAAATDLMDESYMRVFGGFGEVRLGWMDPLTLALSPGAPYIGINPSNADQNSFIVAPSGNFAINSTSVGGGDDNRVGYYTPTIAGFRLGGSYTPSTTDSHTQPTVSEGELTDAALMWSGNFGDFALRAGAGWFKTETATDTTSYNSYRFGGDVTFADITFGASYLMRDADAQPTAASGSTSVEADIWNVGVAYRPGPWSVGAYYSRSEGDATIADPDEDKQQRFMIGATYALGPGVELVGNFLYHKYDDEANDADQEQKGWSIVGGISVDF